MIFKIGKTILNPVTTQNSTILPLDSNSSTPDTIENELVTITNFETVIIGVNIPILNNIVAITSSKRSIFTSFLEGVFATSSQFRLELI